MGHNEAGVISVFKQTLKEIAETSNLHFNDYPLGGQDRYTLADDFWVSYDHFAIVESKWSEKQLGSEGAKFKRLQALCKALANEPSMAALHAQCHQIAWRDSKTKRLMSRVYRDEICCHHFPKTCNNITNKTSAITIDDFGEKFFGRPPSHCLKIDDFITYIRWLTKVITGTEREITVLARGKDTEGYTISSEISLIDLRNSLPQPPSTRPRIKI
ncbi:hypothetical protein [Burkholderia vietnamiensis]|uniref:hypothetical protein n=1 Tax=Burkholderia vietnamiensis TaxID=60552 RepID=UPI0018DD0A4F|nr:hypothetical protein [Burkholderia vietnamiensis]MBH9642362.1 hypothetical protein [Burkholderia vietnamiensis]